MNSEDVKLYANSTSALIFSAFAIVLYAAIRVNSMRNHKGNIKGPPSPPSHAIIGHLHLLSKYPTNPWLGFNMIREMYGDVVYLKLGHYKTVLISSTDAIREVLLTKGEIFGNRPHFYRHTLIFGRERENSLALCDWSELQKSRRLMAQVGILPRYGSKQYKHLDACIQLDINEMFNCFESDNRMILEKDMILAICGNIFLNFLCSQKFSFKDNDFMKAIYLYDYVFYEINQCYASDFLPFLGLFQWRYYNKLEGSANELRKYVEDTIVMPRYESLINRLNDNGFESHDFLDYILEHHIRNSSEISWQICMFEIGDLIGGHSAVGNLLMRLIGHIAVNETVQEEMHKEANHIIENEKTDSITLEHRSKMPLSEASILETLRIASSPIVPHVASQDTTLQGYDIDKGTMILFNTYQLNMSSKYWDDPEKFNPSRFLSKTGDSNGVHVTKPDNFFPFSSGRRACLGYKMVSTIAFSVITNLILKYKIVPADAFGCLEVSEQLAPKGCLALSPDTCFKVKLISRAY